MKAQEQKYRLNIITAEQVLKHHMKRFDGFCSALKSLHSSNITKFLSFIKKNAKHEQGNIVFTGSEIIRWIKQISKTPITARAAALKISSVEKFLGVLVSEQMISCNPIKIIKENFGKRGWKGIVLALRSRNPEKALESVRIPPLFTEEFGIFAEEYLALQESIGKPYGKKIILSQFNRFLNSRSIGFVCDITESTIRDWIETAVCSRSGCKSKLLVLRQFFNYLCDLEMIKQNPVCDFYINNFGYSKKTFKPHIYSHSEIVQLLDGAKTLNANPQFTLKSQTLHMIICLLYTLGLRIGEALRFTIRDIDLNQETLFIRNSKFYKDRVIPFGPKLGEHLKNYLDLRCKLFTSVRLDDPLFITRRCAFIRNRTIQYVFLDVLKAAGIVVAPGQRRPRLHDLRHSFAVHRLLHWYKEGVDVQNKLPLLSTFMGHVNIYSSQIYLTITDDILMEANDRFYSQCGTSLDKENLL